MATYDELIKQAANSGSGILPGPNADAVVPSVPAAMQRGEEMPEAEFQAYMDSIVPVQPASAPLTPAETKMAGMSSVSAQKQSAVSSAASQKQQSMTPADYFRNAVGQTTGAGMDSASALERDLRNLSQFDILAKYGAGQGQELIQGQAGGMQQEAQIETAGSRDLIEKWDDFNVDAGAGVAGAIGGVGSLAASLFNADAGVATAEATGDAIDFMNSERSPNLAARQRLNEARNSLTERDNAAQFEKDRAEDGDVVAGLKRVGRDIVDSVGNASDDSAVFGSGISNALGSFAAVGPVGKAVKALSGGLLGTTTAIAATEAGGSYQQIASDIAERDFETLQKESPMFRELIANGMSPDEARTEVANKTGLFSAAITAPVAAAAGRLVSRFEGDLGGISRGGMKQVLGNIGRETLEEAAQSGTGQLAQNVAEQDIANTDKQLSEGVGRSIGEGALYGAGMSAALGVPGVARNAAGKAGNAIAERVAGIQETNQKASPVADETVAQAAAEMQASAPQAEAVLREAVSEVPAEQQEQAASYVDTLMSATKYEAAEAPAQFQEYMGDVTSRVGAIQRMAEIVNSAEEGSPDQLRAGFYLNSLVQDFTDTINADPDALSSLPAEHQAAQIVGQYQNLMGAITSTPKVMGAIETVMAAIEKAEAKQATVDAQTLATPEGQQDVADALGIAELAPEKGDLKTNEQILFQVQQGNLTVTPRQKAALDTSVALLRAVQAADQAAVQAGESDPVSLNISSVDGEKGKSVTQHAKGIMSAWKSGDLDLAADRILDLKNFAQGMSNKVVALNTHLAAGNPNAQGLSYDVFVAGKPVTSKAKMAVRTHNANSVAFAQKVAREAKLLTDVYNGLAEAFPNLSADHLSVTPLSAELIGPATEVANRYQQARQNAPQAAAPTAAPKASSSVVTSVTPEVAAAPTAGKTVTTPVEAKVETVAPTQKVEAEPVVAEETVVEPTEESTPVPKGMAAVYPGVTEAFRSAFKLPSKQRTRIIGEESPVAMVQDALRDSASFTAFLGSAPQGQYTKEIAAAYKNYLSMAENFVGELDDRLQAYLDSPYSKKNPTTIRQVLSGEKTVTTGAGLAFDPIRSAEGKAAAITETVDGEVVYNPELIQAATLAGMQWFLNSDQYGTTMDAKDIAELLGMTEATVADDVVNRLNQGMSVTEAKRSLATKIRSYWGLQNSPDGLIGMQEGVPEAIAAEIIEVMLKNKWLTVDTISLSEKDGLPPNQVRTIDRLIPADYGQDSPLRAMPSAIEQAVLLEPEEMVYIGGQTLPPVAQDQLRNPGIRNTPQQLQAIENEQKTPYFVNPHMAGFYMAMGKDAVVKMFGAGNIDQKSMNKNHAQSMDGVNRSTVAAFDHLQNLLLQVENNGKIDQTPIHYGFNMTRVARLQMLGKYNPQANKMVREAILPTRTTLDLSTQTGQGYKQFTLGLAQLLGVKVHKMFPARSRAKVEAMLSGPLAPAVAALQNWGKGFDNSQVNNPSELSASVTDTIIDAFKAAGEPLTPMGLHAVMDYARYLNAEDKSKFTTSIYVEADGVTNGPINAMVLFTTGAFRGDWVRNIAKGGLFFNRPGETVNSNVEGGDSSDLYQATTDKLKGFLGAMRDQYAGNPAVTEQLNNLFYMMDEFLGGDLQFDGENLILQRGIAKNPLTITIYGSGAGGIAGKMTKMVADAIYERMSQVAEARNAGAPNMAVAMFGPQSSSVEEAQQRLERFAKAFTGLTTLRAKMTKDGLVFSGGKMEVQKTIDPVNFTFTKDQLENMQSNMRQMFVDPMRDAIASTVGEELMSTADMLRQATQAQSIVLEHAFKDEVNAALAENAKDPNWRASDFLTRKQMDAINKKLSHLSPMVRTGTQDFFIAGSQSVDVGAAEFGRSTTGTLRTDAFVSGPKDAGVAGIPFMNIGAGDGQMMQNISVADGAPTGTLKIFDGMNMPLDQVEAGSLVANKAVYDSWQGNPLAAVHKSFSDFVSDAKLTDMSDSLRAELSKSLFGLDSDPLSEAEITTAMTDLVQRLDRAQQSIEARHRVMDRVAISVDQMAAASAPFTKSGDLLLAGTDPDAIAEQLSAYYEVELERIRDEKPTRNMEQTFYDMGTQHESGVTLMSGADLAGAIGSLSENQQAVLAEVVNSLRAKDYTIVLGDAQQIADYNAERGLQGMSSMPSGDVKGYTNVGTKQIYLLNPSSETFVHELIHAATFEAVDAHYTGEQTNAAVPRIEAMMEQFRKGAVELTQASETLNATYNSALSAINGHLAAKNKAAALNEFMAWTLANESLARAAQRTQVSRLGRIKETLIGLVKDLLGIKAKVGTDVFSNLLFNSAILMHVEPSLKERFTASTLFQNAVYGDSDRLSEINAALDKAIGRYLNEAPQSGKADPESALTKGIQNGIRVADAFMSEGFMMNMQEASTFRTIVTALSTEAQIDPNAMAAVQQLYAHVMKNLNVESFMVDPTNDSERYYAAKKYDVLSGKSLVTRDIKGRSSLLPAFLALATTNEEFRQVLSKIDMPKTALNSAGTLDALLENTGNKLMDSLSGRMSGQGKKPASVVSALDNLNAHMAKIINDRETFIDQMASKGQGVLDRANDLVVSGMGQLAAGLLKNSKRANRNASNKLDRTVAGIGAGVAALIDNTAAAGVSQATMAAINKTDMWNSVHSLINDLVGRTESNANVYDMIKSVRSMVARTRQQYRENLPELLNSKFTRELTTEEKSSLHTSMGKTDLAALGKNALELATVPALRAEEIKSLESGLTPLHIAKAKQLANYMVNGVPGVNLLRNAEAVSRLLGENQKGKATANVAAVDQLISLYAIEALSQTDKEILASLAQSEAAGLNFSIDYLRGQRADEMSRATGNAKMNAFKGYIPNMLNDGMSMVIASDAKYSDMVEKSYTRVGDYKGSSLELGQQKGYYFIPVASRGSYEQGIMQNVIQTSGGVNASSGLQVGNIAGAITEQADVKMLAKRMSRDTGREPLMPVYDEAGNVMAFERSVDPEVMERLYAGNDITKAIGVWRGRQVEEGFAQTFNERLIDNLKDVYEKDMAESLDNRRQYVDVFNTKDPVIQDAVKLLSHDTRAYVEGQFGGQFWIRKDMLNDALGYRTASVGDIWTGNSRWSPETQKTFRNLAASVLGNHAYRTLMNAEKTLHQIVSDAKVLIVVKSVVVPAVNLVSNLFQLAARGVPVMSIAKSMPKKTAEVEAYTRSLVRRIEAEAELRAATGDVRAERKLKTEIQAINDSHRRMSIWPLIEAGEFSGISDAGLTRSDIELTSGRLQAFMESAVNKLPGAAKNFGRYALVTKDTALYQGLQKSVEYGDFLAKAVLFDDLTQRKGMNQKDALAMITEEFVNYDRLSGRFRSTMENMGLLWFYNFKIRSVKVALSMVRNNPVHALLASLTPSPTLFGTVGLPTEDNLISKMVDGSIWNSIGPAQGAHAASLNPWYNLTQ